MQQTEYMADGQSVKVRGGYVCEQISPLASRFGGRLAGYAEFGFGYKGLFNIGMSYSIGANSEQLRREFWR